MISERFRTKRLSPPQGHSFYQRVEDNAFHLLQILLGRALLLLIRSRQARALPLALSGSSQRTFPFKQRRMGVIKAAVERVRGEIAQVFFAQFPQRVNQ